MVQREVETETCGTILGRRIADWNFQVEPWIDRRLETRIRNSLQRAGIHTVADLVNQTRAQLEKVDGLGIVCMLAIEARLKRSRLKLKKT